MDNLFIILKDNDFERLMRSIKKNKISFSDLCDKQNNGKKYFSFAKLKELLSIEPVHIDRYEERNIQQLVHYMSNDNKIYQINEVIYVSKDLVNQEITIASFLNDSTFL